MSARASASRCWPPASAWTPTHGCSASPFAEALRFWLKLGFISFGGPAGQIAIMHTELVERRRWISEKRFLHALNYCMLLPGPEAQQLATYIGWLMHRTWGGIVAGALFVLPSLFILIALSWIYLRFGDVPLVAGHLLRHQAGGDGHRAAGRAPHRQRALKNRWLWGIGPAAAFVAIFALEVPFPAIVLAAALIGLAIGAGLAAWCSRWAAAMARQGGPGPGADRRRHAHAAPCALQRAGWRRCWASGCLLWAGHGMALLAWHRAAGRARWRRWAGSSPRRRC
jgi:chromate transport protein ChrA